MAITQLPAANYTVSEAIPLSFVNCQASSSAADTTNCGTNAIHRNAYTGVAYDIPVGVHGGAFPYGFELTSAPSGMTIGENYSASDPSDSYGRITWATPTAGNHTITVQVTDQEGTVITSTWTLVVGTANWVFVDGSAGTGGDGSIGSPYDSLDDVLTGHAGELCYIRASTLTLTSNFQLNTDTPVALIGYPSETADIAMTDGWFVISALDDGAFKNLTLRHLNMTAATQDRKCISQLAAHDRNSFIDITVTNFEYGVDGNNNGSVFSSFGAINNDQFFHNWDVQASNMSTVIQVFKHRNSLIQKINVSNTVFNSGSGSSNGGAIKLKDGWSDLTIRLCELWDNNTWTSVNSCIEVAGQDQSSLGIDATDICYNTLYQPSTANQNGCFRMYTQNQSGAITNTHVYRNSLRADVGEDAEWSNGLFTGMTHTYEKNVVENGTLRDDGDAAGWYNLDNVEGTTVVFDANLQLTGTARIDYIGTHGSEISSTDSIATPTIDTSGNLVVEFSEVVSDGGSGIDDFTIAGRTLSNFVLDASGNTITADVSPVFEATDNSPEVVYTQPTGGLQTVGAVDVPSFSILATNNSTQDNTAPVLSSPLGTPTGSTTATGTVTTDEGNGTLYWEVTASATPTSPNATFISDATTAGDTQAVSATGSQIVSVTGLTAATSYYVHFLHVDAAANESIISTSAQFTTEAAAGPTLFAAQINSAGSSLILTFSEAVQESGSESAVTLSSGNTLSAPTGGGTSTLTYALSPYAVAGDVVTVSFAGGANVIEQNGGGADTEAFTDEAVTNSSTETYPVVLASPVPTIDATGTVLTIYTDDILGNLSTPQYTPFSLTGGYTFSNALFTGTGATFTITPEVQQGDVVTLAFTQAGGEFTSTTSGLELQTFSGTAVTNNSTVVTVPPVFVAGPEKARTTISGHTIRQTLDKNGTVYGVMVAADSPPPTPSQVKAGTDEQGGAPLSAKSVASVAGQFCSLVFSAGEKNTAYNYYIVAEDSVPNLQTSVVRVTATTDNLLFNGSGQGLPAAAPKKKVKMKWDDKKKRR